MLTSALVAWTGLGLLITCFVVGHDLATTSDAMKAEVARTDSLILSNVRTLSETQRELLRLQHALDVDAPSDEIRLLAGFVSQRTHESALSYQSTTLGSAALLQTARDNEASWLNVVQPAVRASLRRGPAAAAAEQQAMSGIDRLELSYNYLASQGEINRREQVSSTNESSVDLAADLQRMLAMFSALFAAGVAAGLTGVVLFVRVNRRRTRAVRELSIVNDDLTFYSRVVHASDSALVATDREGHITWVNDAFEEASGWTLAEIAGRRPGDFLTGPSTDPDVIDGINAAIVEGNSIRAELAQYTSDGREYWVATDISPLANDDGEIDGFFAVQTDITERHTAEEFLTAAREAAELAVQQKSAFLATMSHEIRTPLNAVLGLTDLLMLTGLDDEQRDYVETAHRSGGHLLELINDVLDYSALESGRLEYASDRMSMPQLLRDTVAMLSGPAENKGVSLRLHCSDGVPEAVFGDSTRLRQVLVNVIGNAVKFTARGTVTVTCDATLADPHTGFAGGAEADIAAVSSSEAGADPTDAGPRRRCEIVTTVTDTGIGIPDWRVPELFQSFVRGDASTTREYGGTGLGLAISRGLLDAMGGTIELHSALGVGTTVTITTTHDVEAAVVTPADAPQVLGPGPHRTTPHGPSGTPETPGSRVTVLVAEDDPVNRKVVTRMLAKLGIAATVVDNGQQAVEAVAQGSYDIVLMDVEMPVMDGLCAVGRIRRTLAQADTPTGAGPDSTTGEQPGSPPSSDVERIGRPWFIALTANALSGDRERFLQAGMDDYLSKPVTLQTLQAALDRAHSVAV